LPINKNLGGIMSEHQDPDPVVRAGLDDRLSGLTEVNAPTPMSNATRDARLAPGAGTRQFLPRDEQVECQLLEVEKMIRGRSFNKAFMAAQAIKLGETGMASTYALLVGEKMARAQLSSGDRHLARGDRDKARASYQAAIDARTHVLVLAGDAARLANHMVSELVKLRTGAIASIGEMIIAGQYQNWCGARHQLQQGSILDHLDGMVADVSLEQALGPHLPVGWPPRAVAEGGWRDPVAVDDLGPDSGLGNVVLDRPVLLPGAAFSTVTNRPVSLEAIDAFTRAGVQAQPMAATVLRASSALPLVATMLTAHARLYALDFALSPIGLSPASIPVYRYRYLREQAARLLKTVGHLDARMLDMQFQLDDFSELIDTVRRNLDETSAEYQALDTRAGELQNTVAVLARGVGELGDTVGVLARAEDECDVEWWEYVVSVLVVIAATAAGAGIGFLLGGPVGALAGGTVALITSIQLTIQVWNDRAISCDNVEDALGDFRQAHQALKTALADHTAELNYTLLQRDAVVANLASLQYTYDEAMLANQARVLNATTLSHILGVLDSVRSSTVLRAHTLARMAQDAFNAETDSRINVVGPSHADYLDQDARGYTAAAMLQRDLDAVEHIRITSRTRKSVQLSQVVSLRKHYPSAFGAILLSGHARFSTRIAEFDRWYPGMYMQRLQEVKVEVLVDGVATPVRGYLSNDGTSLVRFPDHGNKVQVDGRDVFNEPDPALRQLCFKRRRRHHSVDTMAFPHFASPLADARAQDLQREERNVFEGCGLETTWHLEILPDQQVDLARITDVRIDFGFEAMFDAALKQVVEKQRYRDRIETALLSVRELVQGAGGIVDFSQPLKIDVNAFRFEAPHLDKPLVDVGIMLRHRQAPLLDGAATLRVGVGGAAPVELVTSGQGIVATSPGQPAGTNTAALQAMIDGQSVAGAWFIEIASLPAGVQAADIGDMLLMLRYTFKEPEPEPVPAPAPA
jgi:hypothetical protein